MKVKIRRKDMTPRQRRQRWLRKRLAGTPERPRLSVFCSLKYIYAQVIDDTTGCVLASSSSAGKRSTVSGGRANVAAAEQVGRLIADAARAAQITQVVFDRAGYKYHGRVKALAEAARAAGLQF
jgi:large subunit ribosomal protein L18